ncbi:hypothetical protein Tsubulata_015249 [Turnera subulata]|uniref:Ataxin-2 C-terminal domain-containing protein n=1 Tax=Turnera subulata TaxID=218843 RepID=A0A9Q0F7L1_9ROSI|nr:hypothetical protein Tsubulata_015249 [Turnera subulata]
MAMVSAGHRSTLNPNAPLFIPFAYQKVEDFSPEWWELVKDSNLFPDFWLSEHPEGSFDGSGGGKEVNDDVVDLLPEDIDVRVNEDEFADLDAQIELVMLAQADDDSGYTTNSTDPITQRKAPTNGK